MNTPTTGVDGALTPEKIAEKTAVGGEKPTDAVARYAVRLGDDALILAQRLGGWIAHAPELEEDVALANVERGPRCCPAERPCGVAYVSRNGHCRVVHL